MLRIRIVVLPQSLFYSDGSHCLSYMAPEMALTKSRLVLLMMLMLTCTQGSPTLYPFSAALSKSGPTSNIPNVTLSIKTVISQATLTTTFVATQETLGVCYSEYGECKVCS